MNLHLYKTVIDWIPAHSRVLDLGTGDGTFLKKLIQEKNVHGEAVEKNPELLAHCIESGLVAYQGDILDGLDQYGNQSFDYVLLLGTFQELLSPEKILHSSFRVARYVILAFTNFAYWRARLQLMFRGSSPDLGNAIPWYENPNIQFFSILDFQNFCRSKKISSLRSACFNKRGTLQFFPNLRSEEVLILMEWED